MILIILVIIVIVVASIVIIAKPNINKIAMANNEQRQADVDAILNAVYQFSLEQDGTLPVAIDNITSGYQVIGTASNGCDKNCTAVDTESACANLSSELTPAYITAIPFDPVSGGSENTGYYINRDSNNKITVGACDPERRVNIKSTR